MISYGEALDLLLAQCQPLAEETSTPADAEGRVLAAAVDATVALPPFDNAAMDGYALAATSGTLPAGSVHAVAGILAAGDAASAASAGAAWQIMTGAGLPAGSDRVAALERTEVLGHAIRLRDALPAGHNVRLRGSDLAPGDRLGHPGQRIDPALRMVLAAAGIPQVRVRRRPRVAIVTTGNELVDDPALPLREGQIYGSNGPFLEAFLHAMGAEVIARRTLGDDPQEFTRLLAPLAGDTDLVLSTGAVSMGVHDFVPSMLAAAGARQLFHKVAIRPGKPVLAARLAQGPLLIALPGNPVATAVGARFFVAPVVRAMLGLAQETPLHAQLDAPLSVRSGLRHFLKAQVRADAHAQLQLGILTGQQSFRMAPLLQANAWAIVDETASDLASGSLLAALPRDPAGGWHFG